MNVFVYIELMAEKIYKINSEKWNPRMSVQFQLDEYGKIECFKGCNNLQSVCLFFIHLPTKYIVRPFSLFNSIGKNGIFYQFKFTVLRSEGKCRFMHLKDICFSFTKKCPGLLPIFQLNY